jgi:hypothetical protein
MADWNNLTEQGQISRPWNPVAFSSKICSILRSTWYIIRSNYYPFFDRETDADWDKELAEDVKGECESKYGPVDRIKVEKETQVKLTFISTTLDY